MSYKSVLSPAIDDNCVDDARGLNDARRAASARTLSEFCAKLLALSARAALVQRIGAGPPARWARGLPRDVDGYRRYPCEPCSGSFAEHPEPMRRRLRI